MTLMRSTVARILTATLAVSAVSAFAATDLTGAGGTFPAPVYAKWAAEYQKPPVAKSTTRALAHPAA